METIFINTENSKTNKPHKFALNWSQRISKKLKKFKEDLKSSKKHVFLQNLSIYYTRKNIYKKHKNKKLKTIAPTWNDEFELPGGSYSVSDIQDYIE